VRLIDTVFRQGHLSERALVDAIVTGERPIHLDRCDICAERAVQLARWMDELQTDAAGLADDVFTPERLTAQQNQILRRLEQLDHPARVIAFPAASRPEPAGLNGRRVAVSWVGVAAAAGLAIGLVGGQLSARLDRPVQAPVASSVADSTAQASIETLSDPADAAMFDEPFESLGIPSLDALNELTPRLQISARSGG
jgi:hypothetical protein